MGQKALISDIGDRFYGKPIYVICGGCTTAEALEIIPADYPACVISANGHGFKQDKFKVDFIVHVDVVFSKTNVPSAQHFAQYKTPTISRWSFADYRIPEYSFSGDSGMMAVHTAMMLGGWPVVVSGLDRNRGPRRYWWEKAPESGWTTRRVQPLPHVPNVPNLAVNAQRLITFAAESEIRQTPAMAQLWPWRLWRLDEQMPPFRPPSYPQATAKGEYYNVLRRMFLHPADPVGGGKIKLTLDEAKPHLRAGNIR